MVIARRLLGVFTLATLVHASGVGVAEAQEPCVPDCRSGYVCVEGQCVSACNPPCDAGQECTSGGTCVAPVMEQPSSSTTITPAPAPAVTPAPTAPSVEFRPRVADISLHLDEGGSYRHLCTGFCEVPLAPGTYRLALSRFGREPITAPEQVTFGSAAVLDATYRNRKAMRVAGWVLFGVGLAAVVASFVWLPIIGTDDIGVLIPGMIGGAVFAGVGLTLVLLGRDGVTIGVMNPTR